MVSTGTDAVTASGSTAEVPPPGAGLNTTTLNVPAPDTSSALSVVVSSVALTSRVARTPPETWMMEPALKPVPVTRTSRLSCPASADDGVIAVTTGAGLVTGSVLAGEAPPPGPGLLTITRTSRPAGKIG